MLTTAAVLNGLCVEQEKMRGEFGRDYDCKKSRDRDIFHVENKKHPCIISI